MAPVLPLVVFAAGLTGLGYWAHQDHLEEVEQHIQEGAAGAVSGFTQHPLSVEVSGRDIKASGFAHTEAQKDEILAALGAVDGRRVVVDEIETLPIADPYVFNADKADGQIGYGGVMPDQGAIDVLAGSVDANRAEVTLAAGEPNGNWGAAVMAGTAALGQLEGGTLTMFGTGVDLKGEAAGEAELAAAIDALGAIDPAYSVTHDISVPKPSNFDLSYTAASGIAATGALIGEERVSQIAQLLPQDRVAMNFETDATLPLADLDVAVNAAIPQIDRFDAATLSVSNDLTRFEGTARVGEDADALKAELQAALPEGADIAVTPAVDVPGFGDSRTLLASDGAVQFNGARWLPVIDGYSFSASKTDDGLSFSGVVPQATDKEALNAYGDTSNVAVAGGWPDAQWSSAVNAGLTGLGQLETGEFTMLGQSASLSGRAADGAIRDAAQGLALPEGYTTDVAVVAPEPPAYVMAFDANSGATLDGNFPNGTQMDDLTQAVGVTVVKASISDAAAGEPAEVVGKLDQIGSVLGEFETATLTVDPNTNSFVGETLKGANPAILTANIKEMLGPDSTVTVTRTARDYENGVTRLDPVTGEILTASNNYWIPLSEFAVTPTACISATERALAEGQVDFVSSRADLDVSARRVISRISGILTRCFEGTNMRLVLSGHTDSVGDEAGNLRLSNGRAQNVRTELVNRGLPGERMTAIGYGETQPVADNATAEGRARNRRTEIEWVQN